MKPALWTFCFALWGIAASGASVRVEELRCEHLENPIGIGVRQPRLSWKLVSGDPGERQTAYQIRAGQTANGEPGLWDSGKVASDQSVLVPWQGKPLGSRSRVFWQVRVWDKDGRAVAVERRWLVSNWACLSPATEWKGQWITADLPRYDIEQSALAKSASWINAGSTASQAAGVRLTVQTSGQGAVVRSAAIDAAADGLITIYVNGHAHPPGLHQPDGAACMRRLARQLTPGTNVIAIGSAAVRGASGVTAAQRAETPSPPTASSNWRTDGGLNSTPTARGKRPSPPAAIGSRRRSTIRLGTAATVVAPYPGTLPSTPTTPWDRAVICGRTLSPRSRLPGRGSMPPRWASTKSRSTASASAIICWHPAGPTTPSA